MVDNLRPGDLATPSSTADRRRRTAASDIEAYGERAAARPLPGEYAALRTSVRHPDGQARQINAGLMVDPPHSRRPVRAASPDGTES
jgi:hypothetical protein